MDDDGERECRALMAAVLPFARQTLRRHGSLVPVGAGMRPDGALVPAVVDLGEGHRKAAEIIALVKRGLTQAADRGEYKATALLYECVCRFDPANPTDAVAVCLDHRDGYSEIFFQCFRLEEDGATGRRRLIDGPVHRFEGEGSVFCAAR